MTLAERLAHTVCGLVIAATLPAPKGLARCRGPFPSIVWRLRAIPRMIRRSELAWRNLQRLT